MSTDKKVLFVPIDINCKKYLPKVADREYTKLEAMFSVQLDYFQDKGVSISGYSKLWKWSRKRVNKFLQDIGVEVKYEESTTEKQNQRGQIGLQIRDRSGTDKEQIRFIDNKDLENKKDRSGTDKEQIRNRSGSTTNNSKKENKKEYSEDSKEFRCSLFLLNKIRERKPDYKMPDLQKWSEQSDYIFRLDKRDPKEVKSVIEWCQKDEFWQDNILSTAKLRKQYDKLVIKMRKNCDCSEKNNSETLKKLREKYA